MPFNITIDHETTRHNSDRSSSSATDEDSSDTGVHLSPHSDNYDYQDPEEQDGSWTNVLHPDEIRPSDSASRPRTSNRQRPLVEAPQPEDARRPSYRRRITHERIRNVPAPRSHHSPPSTEPESVDAHDEWQGDARGLQHGRQYAHYAPPGYPPAQYQTFPSHSVVPAGHHQQMVPFGFPGYPGPPGGPAPNYFAPQHAMPSYGGTPYSPPGGYHPYAPQGYPMSPAMPPQPVFHPYPIYSPPPVISSPPPVVSTPPPPPPSDTSKDDEKFARLEKLLLDQREEQAAKEAAAEKAAADKAAKAEAEAEKAKEIKTASDKAAKEAKEKADKEHKAAAEKAAKEAEQAAKDAEKAAADAAAAKPPPPPAEKKKPIKFKDAVGRKFSFPFHLCCTWSGMEYLIKEAFAPVEVIGPHVEQGHYDLLGPQGEIILPHVWETVIEPDWTITMHMWPMTEEKEAEPLADVLDGIEIVEGLPPPPPPAPSAPGGAAGDEKKPKKKKEKPPPFFAWPGGKKGKGTKAKKKS